MLSAPGYMDRACWCGARQGGVGRVGVEIEEGQVKDKRLHGGGRLQWGRWWGAEAATAKPLTLAQTQTQIPCNCLYTQL